MRLSLLIIFIQGALSQEEFNPTLNAVCSNQFMTIRASFQEPFFGLLISRANRNRTACYVEGDGGTNSTLELKLNADPEDNDFCGIQFNHQSGEKSVQVAVRQHKTLELSKDKQFLISCSKLNTPVSSSSEAASLSLSVGNGRDLKEVINSRAYELRVKTKQNHFKVRDCFAFGSKSDSSVPFFDEDGCPVSKITSKWVYKSETMATSTIYSMFRFQDNNQVTFQCVISFCDGPCTPSDPCLAPPPGLPQPISFAPSRLTSNSTIVIASTTVNVLNPGESASPLSPEEDVCTGFCPRWLLWLAIVLGVLFILMLLVNLFLCTALTCTCTRTELVEKDPSILEDYDPYTWSQYGGQSKYSESAASDHYATPGMLRPDSRFSNKKI